MFGPRFLNRASPQRKLLSGSFHPNPAGQDKLAAVVSARLANLDR